MQWRPRWAMCRLIVSWDTFKSLASCLLAMQPMVFMMISTLVAMAVKVADFYREGQTVLLVVGGCITLIAVWLVVEAFLALRRYRREGPVESLDVTL